MTAQPQAPLLVRLLERTTRPSSEIASEEDRQKARILLSFVVAMMATITVVAPLWSIGIPDFVAAPLMSALLLLALVAIYVISRTRHILVGAVALVASLLLLIWGIILTAPGSSLERMQTLYYVVVVVMVAALFLTRPMILTTLAACTGTVVAFLLLEQIAFSFVFSFLVFFIVLTLIGAVNSIVSRVQRVRLVESEERYRSLVAALNEGIIMFDAAGYVQAANEAAAAMLGVTTAQLVGTHPSDRSWQALRDDGAYFPLEEQPHRVTLRTGRAQHGVVMGIDVPPRGLRWFSVNSQPLRRPRHHTPYAVAVSFFDITEQRLAQSAQAGFLHDMRALQMLHISLAEIDDLNELQRAMVASTRAVLGIDRVALFLRDDANDVLQGTYGTDAAGQLRDERHMREALTPDHWAQRVMKTADHVVMRLDVLLMENGEVAGEGWRIDAALWNGSRPVGYLVADNLLTQRAPRLYEAQLMSILGTTFGHLLERKRVESALRQSEARHRALLNAIPDIVFRHDRHGTYLDYHAGNPADLYVPPDRFLGRTIAEVMPPDIAQRHLFHIDRVLASRQEAVYDYALDIRGRTIQFEARVVAASDSEVITIIRNITERKQVLEALRQSEQRFSVAFRNSPVPMVITTARGSESVYVDMNPAFLDLSGYTYDELVGKRLDDLELILRDGHYAEVAGQMAHGRQYTMREAQMRNRHGEVREVMMSGQRVAMNNSEYDIDIILDVTEQKQAQQRAFDLALERERVALLQHFIEKTTHEFRTPLAIINSSVYLMTRQEQPDQRAARAALVQQQVQRISKMVDMLILMSRLESGQLADTAPINLAALIGGVADQARMRHGPQPPLRLEIASDLPRVMGSAGYLAEALTQLIDNAYRFTPGNGSIDVRASTVGEEVWVEVRDTGRGIPAEDVPHIFDTFWQRDASDLTPGLGLGLGIVRRIIEAHRGTIDVTSDAGQGSCFRLVLPASS